MGLGLAISLDRAAWLIDLFQSSGIGSQSRGGCSSCSVSGSVSAAGSTGTGVAMLGATACRAKGEG